MIIEISIKFFFSLSILKHRREKGCKKSFNFPHMKIYIIINSNSEIKVNKYFFLEIHAKLFKTKFNAYTKNEM